MNSMNTPLPEDILAQYLNDIEPQATYNVRMPDFHGLLHSVQGERLARLPHWRKCVVTTSLTELRDIRYVAFVLPENLRQRLDESSFRFGSALDARKLVRRVRSARQSVEVVEERVRSATQELASLRSLAESYRKNYVEFARQVAKGEVDERYTKERLREVFLGQDDILDVRFAGEVIRLDDFGAANFEVPDGEMVVTFVGPLIASRDGVCPLPPTMIRFTSDGHLLGGPLCIHPHMKPNESCLGTAQDLIRGAAAAGDVYAAVDIARMYRFGYNHNSPLNSAWAAEAWEWWIDRINEGWPEREPFTKPWIAEGFPVCNNRTGKRVSLETVTGASDDHQLLNALHIGLYNGMYSNKRFVGTLAIVQEYQPTTLPQTASYCSCGYQFEVTRLEALPTRLVCACHGNALRINHTLPCPTCNRSAMFCRCPYVGEEAQWRFRATGRGTCEECDRVATEVFDLVTHTPDIFNTYHGPRHVCAAHLPASHNVHSLPHPADFDAEVALRWGSRCANCWHVYADHHSAEVRCPNGFSTTFKAAKCDGANCGVSLIIIGGSCANCGECYCDDCHAALMWGGGCSRVKCSDCHVIYLQHEAVGRVRHGVCWGCGGTLDNEWLRREMLSPVIRCPSCDSRMRRSWMGAEDTCVFCWQPIQPTTQG